jgi:N-acyl-D-aspartate/D-glutamate deacylase
MRIFRSILLTLLVHAAAFGQDMILINGRVLDGTGKAGAAANVRIRDGGIRDVGPVKPEAGETVLDVKGMIVAPGFVDVRSLSPADFVKDPAPEMLIMRGTTTAVLGSDASGPYSVADFMGPFDEKPPALNIAVLAGHATIRKQILGSDFKRPATPAEIKLMTELASDAMKQGAFGLAADFQHEPGSFSTRQEIVALAQVVARFGGTFVMSLRADQSAKDAISIAREAKVAVHVFTANKAAAAEIEKSRTASTNISVEPIAPADQIASIERRVQRMSSMAASRAGLRERGLLKKGVPADIVVFSSFQDGMKYVFVNGMMIVKDGQLTDVRSGQALR